MLRRTLICSSLALATLAAAGCASGPRLAPVPEGRNGRLKQFKAGVNLVIARIDLHYKNLDSYTQMQSPDEARLPMAKDDIKKLEARHKDLVALMKQADEVAATVEGEAERAAFAEYVRALRVISGEPYGEIDGTQILAVQKAAGALEEIVD